MQAAELSEDPAAAGPTPLRAPMLAPLLAPMLAPIPRWLIFVLKADRAGSSWYIGTGFLFAPVLAFLAPWPQIRTVLWAVIAAAGLWLGLLGIAMAAGLARILRSGGEIPEDYWRSMLDYRTPHAQPPPDRYRDQDAGGDP